jgi:ketosteroid isomerase-like protein
VTDDPRQAVQEANERFYRAFESLDLARMEQIWAHGSHVACIHPGWSRLHGWEEVRRSWAAIFQSTTEMRFTITDVRVEVRGDLGWVHCGEHPVETRKPLDHRHRHQRLRAPGRVLAPRPSPRVPHPGAADRSRSRTQLNSKLGVRP